MRNGKYSTRKIFELAEITRDSLCRIGTGWLLAHAMKPALESRVVVVCAKSQFSAPDGSFWQILDFLEDKGVATLLQGYFDESERTGGIFCVAGLTFAPRQAKKFCKDWSSLFSDYRGDMRDLTQRRGSFEGISSGEQQRLIVEAIKIIKLRMSAAFAVSCNVGEIAATAPAGIKGFSRAYPLCCHLCMTRVGKFLRDSGSEDRVTYFFEAGHPHEGEARTFIRQVMLSPVVKESYRHDGDAFLPKKDAVPLQAADLIAWEWAKFYDETVEQHLRPIRKSFLALVCRDPKLFKMSHITGEPLKRFMGHVRELGLMEPEEYGPVTAS